MDRAPLKTPILQGILDGCEREHLGVGRGIAQSPDRI